MALPSRRTSIAVCFAAGLAACSAATSTTTTTTFTPVTGVSVSADALIGARGCGSQPGQVYKYAAVIYGPSDGADASNVALGAGAYDCYADALFANLANSGVASFTVAIYAYDAPAYAAHASDIRSALSLASLDPTRLALGATYVARCSASQQAGVQVLAICDPLAAP